jgi:hypothetical protein
VRDAVVMLDGPTISYAGPAAGAPVGVGLTGGTAGWPTGRRRAAAVLPGLWDCHGHFMGGRSMDLTRLARRAAGEGLIRSSSPPP